ncbi:MAG: hypothetical protein ACREQL_08170, partial [Candidatus Binatia bacterium]
MTLRGRSSAEDATARLAAVSRLVADQLEATLPAMRAALGPELARWLSLGADLATHAGGATGAILAYLRLDAERVRRVGVDTFARWIDTVGRLGRVSPTLAAGYGETTAALVGDVDAALLDACADE